MGQCVTTCLAGITCRNMTLPLFSRVTRIRVSIIVARTMPPAPPSCLSNDGVKTECLQNVCAQRGAVGTSIQQKRRLAPRAVIRLHFPRYNAIIVYVPHAIDQHKSALRFLVCHVKISWSFSYACGRGSVRNHSTSSQNPSSTTERKIRLCSRETSS